jgi:hypothetical protein
MHRIHSMRRRGPIAQLRDGTRAPHAYQRHHLDAYRHEQTEYPDDMRE